MVAHTLSVPKREELECDMMSIDIKIELENVVACLAGTPECENMRLFYKLEERFEDMQITCYEQETIDSEDYEKDRMEDTIELSPTESFSPPSPS